MYRSARWLFPRVSSGAISVLAVRTAPCQEEEKLPVNRGRRFGVETTQYCAAASRPIQCESAVASRPPKKHLKVCVIGAGAAGLSCAKELIERGFHVTVVEARDGIGGVWRFDSTKQHVGVRAGQRATSSKYYLGFSDFPIAGEEKDFPGHEAYLSYLDAYAKHFKVFDQIRFGCSVSKVSRDADGSKWRVDVATKRSKETLDFDAVAVCSGLHRHPASPLQGLSGNFAGQIVHSRDLKDAWRELKGKRVVVVGGGETGAELAHVAAAAGAKPGVLSLRRGITTIGPYLPLPLSGRMPDARTPPVDLNERRFVSLLPEAMKSFIFTQNGVFELRDSNPGKYTPGRVALAIFGAGSGVVQGVLVALSSVGGAASEFASAVTNPGFWTLTQVPFQQPDGSVLSEQMSASVSRMAPKEAGPITRDVSQLEEYTRRAADFRMRGFTSAHYREVRCLLEEFSGARHTGNFLTKSDDYIYDLMDGSLELRPHIVGFDGGHNVVYADGSKKEADVVVCCTGYSPAVPFVYDPGLTLGEGGTLDPARQLYKRVFAPGCGGTLGFIGFARPQIGAMPPIAELQGRWFAAQLAGDVSLPDATTMEDTIAAELVTYEAKVFSKRLRASVDFAKYTKELACLAGCYPDVGLQEFFTSNLLWRAFWLGPVLPQAYRIADVGEKGVAARRYLEATYQMFFTRD